MKRTLFRILAMFTIAACNNNYKNNADSGPCSYDTQIYSATLIRIDKKDNLNADLLFRIEDKEG